VPGSVRQSREHKKWLAARRAQFRLKQQFDYIDWIEDVLMPETEALLSGRVRLEIEADPTDAAHSIIHVEVTAPEDEDAAGTG
jgi:hypothetical protein